MAILTVRKVGNSLGVIFPRRFVEETGIHERDQIEIDVSIVRDISDLRGLLRRVGAPSAEELNRATNEGEEL